MAWQVEVLVSSIQNICKDSRREQFQKTVIRPPHASHVPPYTHAHITQTEKKGGTGSGEDREKEDNNGGRKPLQGRASGLQFAQTKRLNKTQRGATIPKLTSVQD